MAFHHAGIDTCSQLKMHMLERLTAGVYRSSNKWQVLLFPEETAEEELTIKCNGIASALFAEKGIQAKHSFLWLHPGKDTQMVFLTPDNQVVFHAPATGYTSDVNGYYEYMAGAIDYFYTRFNAKGKVLGETTVLARVAEDTCVWRAVGDEKRIYDDMRELRDWHILAVQIHL